MTRWCWLCHGRSNRITAVDKPVYYHCPVCDLIFIDDNYILNDKEEKERYLLHENTHENKGYVQFLSRFIETAVKPYRENLKTGLDFGCGPGPVLSDLLSAMGIKMDYYDPYFYNHIDFTGKKYHLITATEVLEHVRHPDKVMQFFKEHLTHRGILSIMTLFHSSYNFKKWWYRLDPTHICFYSPTTFNWIAEHFSFDIKYINSKNICVMQNIRQHPQDAV
ncbi:hypothetical protein JOC37_000965 [Desulfohalotomaculum tongense]|uniref:class I SAM-dependent methyltransferase n=1 Tax=Desulforadius tongensis TaxID=1216062 RepID=UPI00195E9DC7|nr:class I SAM-dependent methyltransferase [Desulforadius tongensis]MBM7854592.1 hypothetical protein [Desulforadius tongensis]